MAKGLIRWDPFRTMNRWDPFSELREMQRDMDRLFNRFMGRDLSAQESTAGWMPLVESYMKGNDIVFKCELPGVDPKDVDVSFDETARELIIKGERKKETSTKEEDYLYREVSYGNFERRFSLPEGVKTDELKAKYNNGILEITVPAPQISKGAKKIEIETPKQIEGENKCQESSIRNTIHRIPFHPAAEPFGLTAGWFFLTDR